MTTLDGLLPSGIRWRQDIPTAARQDTVGLRTVKVTAGGQVLFWRYTRREGWAMEASFPGPSAIDQ